MSTILKISFDLLQAQSVTLDVLRMPDAFNADQLVRDATSQALKIAADAVDAGATADDLRRTATDISVSITPGRIDPHFIPNEVLDLLRFMCETWSDIDNFVYRHCDADGLSHYPVVQGAGRQAKLRSIGDQPYNAENIHAAVEWMLTE